MLEVVVHTHFLWLRSRHAFAASLSVLFSVADDVSIRGLAEVDGDPQNTSITGLPPCCDLGSASFSKRFSSIKRADLSARISRIADFLVSIWHLTVANL
jgi:hypothetical protein